jgi:hypothetical protein
MYNKEYHKDYYKKNKKFKDKNICKYCGKDISNLNKGLPPSLRRTTCYKCLKLGPKDYFKGKYKLRKIGQSKNRGIYCFTVPGLIVEKYNLFGKVFKFSVNKKGKIIIYTE